MLVYVINKDGKVLMPCNPQKSRKLLKTNKAKVITREPFTIQLLYGSSGYKQEITLGVDAGSKYIGLSATTKEKELYSAELQLRTDIVKLLAARKQYRRTRRNRKTRYRKARFLNRVKSKHKGWLAPSIENKIQTHFSIVNKIYKLLPITKIIVETASFDISKIKTPSNLITLCEDCHKNYHSGKLKVKFTRGQSFRDAAFMGIMRWTFYNRLKEKYPNVKNTYGYLTKNTRIANKLPKEHRVDARCISGNPLATPLYNWYYIKQVRKHNRQIHKAKILKGGIRKNNQAPYEVKCFRLFDKVLFKDIECFVFGRRSTGYFDIRLLDGTSIHKSAKFSEFKLLQRAKSLLIENRKGVKQGWELLISK